MKADSGHLCNLSGSSYQLKLTCSKLLLPYLRSSKNIDGSRNKGGKCTNFCCSAEP